MVKFEDQCNSDEESLYAFLDLHVLESHATTNHNKIFDSGSMLTLAKGKNVFQNLRPCEKMVANPGSERIRQQGK